MFAASLWRRSIILIELVFTIIQLAIAAVAANANALPSLQLPDQNTSSVGRDFDLVPSPPSTKLYWPLDSPGVLSNPNYDLPPSNTSNLSALPISCDGKLYGRNFRLASCLQINIAMSSDVHPKTFGKRGTGDEWDAPLPFRYLSNDGLCAIDVGIRAGETFDTISPMELKEAASWLIRICVSIDPSEGGLYSYLGVNKALSLRIVRYRPNVLCGPEGSGPPWMTCRRIIDQMSADSQKQIFGSRQFANTTVIVPWRYTTVKRRCAMTIDGTAPGLVSDTADWYKIWFAANAVDYMCAQVGRKGVAMGLGESQCSQLYLSSVAASKG